MYTNEVKSGDETKCGFSSFYALINDFFSEKIMVKFMCFCNNIKINEKKA